MRVLFSIFLLTYFGALNFFFSGSIEDYGEAKAQGLVEVATQHGDVDVGVFLIGGGGEIRGAPGSRSPVQAVLAARADGPAGSIPQ